MEGKTMKALDDIPYEFSRQLSAVYAQQFATDATVSCSVQLKQMSRERMMCSQTNMSKIFERFRDLAAVLCDPSGTVLARSLSFLEQLCQADVDISELEMRVQVFLENHEPPSEIDALDRLCAESLLDYLRTRNSEFFRADVQEAYSKIEDTILRELNLFYSRSSGFPPTSLQGVRLFLGEERSGDDV